MSVNVPEARVQQYTTDVRHLLQQGASRLRDKVQVRSHRGKGAVAVDQVGKVAMLDVVVRHGPTQYVQTPHSRRWVFPQHKSVADLIDTEDQLELLWDPKGPYQEAQAKAAGRKIDEVILAAALATSVTGETGSSTEAFDTTYQVAHGSIGLTTDKLKAAMQKMMSADVDFQMERVFCAIGSQQVQNLLDDTQYTNLDYVSDAVLPSGALKPFLGINLVVVSDNLLTKASTTRSCVMWCESGIHLGIWNDYEAFVDRLPERNNSWQVMGKLSIGATRLEQGRVVEIQCTES